MKTKPMLTDWFFWIEATALIGMALLFAAFCKIVSLLT